MNAPRDVSVEVRDDATELIGHMTMPADFTPMRGRFYFAGFTFAADVYPPALELVHLPLRPLHLGPGRLDLVFHADAHAVEQLARLRVVQFVPLAPPTP